MRFSLAFLAAVAGAVAAANAVAEPPQVVVDIAPVHALVSQVMDEVATPRLLLDRSADPHSVQLRPSQARMLANADLLIWVGPALSPWLSRIVESQSGDQIALMAQEATHLRGFDQPGEAEHAPGQDDPPHAPTDHGDHDHAGVDPHVWLSTDNARAWLDLFADRLAARDPENAATYRANAAHAALGLDGLKADISARLAGHEGAEIVTFHASFGYFAEEFGLEIAGSVRPGDAAAPSAAAIDRLRGRVADHDIECGFAEPGFDPGLLEAVTAGTGLRIGLLDPTGALQPTGPGHYAATLTAVAEAIGACLDQD